MSLPATHKALTLAERGKVEISERPLPTISDDEILVRVRAVSLNPTDWKHIDFVLRPGQSIGCDFSGDVVAVGSNAQQKGLVSVGDAVAGFVRGGFDRNDNGAFQEYVVALPELVWKKPESLPYEDAAPAGGIALSTAVQALHHRLKLPYEPDSNPKPFLVWAGSTGVGLYAVKLASLAGYKVVTTASPHNFELLKQLGASAVFDYKDPDAPEKIKAWAREQGLGPITKGIDNIAEKGSIQKAVACYESGKGELVILLPPNGAQEQTTVTIVPIMVYTALKPSNEEDFTGMADWNQRAPAYFESGKLGARVVPLKVYEGGLGDLPEALDYVRQGKVSGVKLVVKLQ